MRLLLNIKIQEAACSSTNKMAKEGSQDIDGKDKEEKHTFWVSLYLAPREKNSAAFLCIFEILTPPPHAPPPDRKVIECL
jgi:hypothetical protein